MLLRTLFHAGIISWLCASSLHADPAAVSLDDPPGSPSQTSTDLKRQADAPDTGSERGENTDCCVAHPTAGCDTPECEGNVCNVDPFCCVEEWDETCAEIAGELCFVCSGLSTCCVIHDTPGCDDPVCEALVCAEYPACCDVAWGEEGPIISGACVDLAIDLCGGRCDSVAADCGSPSAGTCCDPNGTPYCNDPACCARVCLGDPDDPIITPDSYCCLVEWDGLCAQAATNNPSCDCFGVPGDCCEVNFEAPGCTDAACEACVCEVDSLCCQFAWFPNCVDIASVGACAEECACDLTPPDCPSSTNDCCAAGFDQAGCADLECCDAVCAVDFYCCEVAWDFTCVNEAGDLCTVCGGSDCAGTIVEADPPSGTVDARQPFPVEGGQLEGLGSPVEPITISLISTGADIGCFSLCETDDGGLVPNQIVNVAEGASGTYTLVLLRPITPNAATTISYADGSFVTYISHPANVDGDALAGPLDVLAVIDVINGVTSPVHGLYSADANRSDLIDPGDILRVIDLLNGADQLPFQLGTPLPDLGNCPQ